MLELINGADTAVLVIHEIYGINENIKSKCSTLYNEGYDVFCPNLLKHDYCYHYDKEEEAYNHFTQFVGTRESAELIKPILKKLRAAYKYLFVVGYSVGATIAWLCSEWDYCDGIICFYGSRIRDFVSINPKCAVALNFAEIEKSFNVEQLMELLRRKQNIKEINKYSGEHGFADPFTEKFNLESYQKSYKDMIEFIEKIRGR